MKKRTKDSVYLKMSIRNSIYHTLNEEVIRSCGQRLPIPHMFYIEGWIDKLSLHNWLAFEENAVTNKIVVDEGKVKRHGI